MTRFTLKELWKPHKLETFHQGIIHLQDSNLFTSPNSSKRKSTRSDFYIFTLAKRARTHTYVIIIPPIKTKTQQSAECWGIFRFCARSDAEHQQRRPRRAAVLVHGLHLRVLQAAGQRRSQTAAADQCGHPGSRIHTERPVAVSTPHFNLIPVPEKCDKSKSTSCEIFFNW